MTDQLSDQQIDELKQAFGIFDKGTGETLFLFCFVFFSYPTSPPQSPVGSVPCVPSNTLSSLLSRGDPRNEL